MKQYKIFTKSLLFITVVLILTNCQDRSPEEDNYIKSIEERREITDGWMKNDPNSPFNYKGKIEFHSLNYFPPNTDFVFSSKFYPYPKKDTVTIFGTKGEERTSIRIGYLEFEKEAKKYKLNVYESYGTDGSAYHSIWFTDKTTNDETYGVGRYLPFELVNDPNHIYTIDFNLAFNPYCAYSPDYSCAIPSREDHLNIAILAGEKKYHE